MTQTVSFTFDDDELASVAIQAIAKYLSESQTGSMSIKSDLPKRQEEWVQTELMARCLGISVRTIHHYRQRKDSPFLKDRHYKRRTPAQKGPWLWNKELTLKAWAQA